jgi:AraC-like DNA-binding protein
MIARPATVPNPPAPFDMAEATGGVSAGLARRHVARFFRSHDLATDRDLPGFRHSHATVGALSLNHLTYGAETTIGMPPLRDFYLLQWTLAGSATYRHDGTEDRAGVGDLTVVNPDRRYEKVWDDACTQLILRVDRSLLDDTLAAWGTEGGRPIEPVIFTSGPVREDARTASLFAFLRALASDARSGGAGWAHPRLAERAGPVLAELMLTALDHSAGGRLDGAGPRRPKALADAQEFIKVHAREALRLGDIAEAAGVRPRTLHKAFQHHLGLTPIAYLKQVRLDLARRDLMEAALTGRTVTDVATACGFDHLSKFAGSYRARYGESPSRTVRRFRTG